MTRIIAQSSLMSTGHTGQMMQEVQMASAVRKQPFKDQNNEFH